MLKRQWLAALSVVLTASACTTMAPPPAATPTLTNIGGYGKWGRATATMPDTFGFSTRPAEDVCPDVDHVSLTTCPARYPDTAFIDFSIPTLTSFEVSSGTTVLTEVAQTATVGDYQYRKAALTDGSTATTTWRIAVSVPNPGRAWCPPTWFPLAIIDVSGGQPSRSAPLPVTLVFAPPAQPARLPLHRRLRPPETARVAPSRKSSRCARAAAAPA